MQMNTEDESLVSHPLVLALTRHKWGFARYFYFLFMFFYIVYLSLLTAYMLSAKKPYEQEEEAEDGGDLFL